MTEQQPRPAGLLVRCLNCGLLWRRITAQDGEPGGTGPNIEDLQYNCPACGSNAFVATWAKLSGGPRAFWKGLRKQ